MSDEIFDSANDYKFPETPVPDETQLFGPGDYTGIVGRIKPFFAGEDGKRAKDGDPKAYLASVSQEIFVVDATENGGTDDQKLVKRIIVNGSEVKFAREASHGIKLFESFPTPSNKYFDKLSWKSRQFYHDFPGVMIGDKGKKKIIWEAIKQYYGQFIMFRIKLADVRGKIYRNIDAVELLKSMKYDAETMAKIETLYDQYKAMEKESAKQEAKAKAPESNIDDIVGAQEQKSGKVDDLPF